MFTSPPESGLGCVSQEVLPRRVCAQQPYKPQHIRTLEDPRDIHKQTYHVVYDKKKIGEAHSSFKYYIIY